jgi:hypothetical protein
MKSIVPLETFFELVPRHRPDLRANCLGGSGDLGERLGLWDDREPNSQFYVVDFSSSDDNCFRLSARHAPDKTLNILGGECILGAQIGLWNDKESNSLFTASFREDDEGIRWYRFHPKDNPELSLNVCGADGKGAEIILWDDLNSNSEFKIVQVGATVGLAAIFEERNEYDTPDRYKILRILGEGGGGMAFLAEKGLCFGINRLVCLKTTRSIVSPLREIKNMCLVPHSCENIVKIYDAFEWPVDSKKWWIEMEPVINAVSWHDYIVRGHADPSWIFELSVQLFRGLDYMHTVCLLSHRDLHGGNVLIADMKKVKIIDLGNACSPDSLGIVGKNCNFQYLRYMSPERKCGDAFSVLDDIWAAGVLVLELVIGHFVPDDFGDWSDMKRLKWVDQNVLAVGVSHSDLITLIKGALVHDPLYRSNYPKHIT